MSAHPSSEVFDVRNLPWRRSQRSTGNGNCAEAALMNQVVLVRDSKNSAGDDFPVIVTNKATWTAFLAEINAGRFES